MKTIQYISVLMALILIGCVAGPYRPMQVGMIWEEREELHVNLESGNYIKQCQYTSVMVNGEYSYDCVWRMK